MPGATVQRGLSQVPFWCERLAVVPRHEKREAHHDVCKEDDNEIWQAMRTQLNDILAQEQTLQAFMAYLVDDQRLMT